MALLLACSFALVGCVGQGEVPRPPGVLAADEPRQTAAEDPTPFAFGNYRLTPLADFRLTARVLSRSVYRFDRESELAPVDLMLGWQRMSDSAVIGAMRFSQNRRWGHWRSEGTPPIPESEIARSASNMHMIAAEPWIEHQLRRVRPGDLVRIDGLLVAAAAEDGFQWRSSLSRTDSGDGACELVFVRYLSVLD